MFVKNSFEFDARVTKEANTLIDTGHQVTVIALHAPATTVPRETTSSGIEVIRVPRSHLGGPLFNRIARRYGTNIETRHSRLTGAQIDEDKIRQHSSIAPTSTATPGDDTQHVAAQHAGEVRDPTALSRAWAKTTTPILRVVPIAAKWVYTWLNRILGPLGRRIQQRAIDSRMVDAGLAVGAEVFHSHDLNTLRAGTTCKAQTPGARLVYDSHELQTERNRMTPKERQTAIATEGRYLQEADAMIVASPSWIEWNRRLYGSIPDPSVTIINVPPVSDVEHSNLFRDELGIDRSKAVLLYQGSIQENRGIEPAIEAVKLIEDVVLVVVGYGHHKPVLEAQVAREGLQDKVLFYGAIPNQDLIRYSASADIGLANIVNSSVSYHTSLPNELCEYAMADIPVIGSDSPEIGRIVREEAMGEVCDADDPQDIASAIQRILSNPGRYSPGLERARERYNWTVEGQKLTDLYSELANG
ncbi:MAG: glycosyltransferase family 4 protein [Actinomycetota bacterium]